MTADALAGRLRRLGYLTHEQAATALGLSRSYLTRMLAGARPIPERVGHALALLETAHPVVLSPPMRVALGPARRSGDLVPYPAPASALRPDWDAVYDAMHAMKLIRYPGPRITRRGLLALRGAP